MQEKTVELGGFKDVFFQMFTSNPSGKVIPKVAAKAPAARMGTPQKPSMVLEVG